MTLKKIAERAEVSISTVSRIMNSPDDSFASKDVRDRVWGIIKETGYTPNSAARALQRGITDKPENRKISIFSRQAETVESNPFYAHLIRAIEQRAMEIGFTAQLSTAFYGDGAIVLGRGPALPKQKNIVYVGRHDNETAYDQIIYDGYAGTKNALDYLISLGHQYIAYIGDTEKTGCHKAYLDTMKENNFKTDRAWIQKSDALNGSDAIGKLIGSSSSLPTAVFCDEDVTAIAVMNRLKEEKLKVPYPISVIGMGNIEASGYTTPMLTTVGFPILDIGSMAVQILASRIQKYHGSPVKIYLPHKIILRDSVANLHGGMYI